MVRYTNTIVFQSGASPTTTSGQTNGFDVSRFSEGLLLIKVTAASGTSPTLSLFLETLDPVTNTWFSHPITPTNGWQYTAAKQDIYQVTNFGQQIRLRWAVSGTNPSFTFSAVFIAKS